MFFFAIVVFEEGGDFGSFAGLALGFEAGLFVEESDVFFVCVFAGLLSIDDRLWDIAGLWWSAARWLEFPQRIRRRGVGGFALGGGGWGRRGRC